MTLTHITIPIEFYALELNEVQRVILSLAYAFRDKGLLMGNVELSRILGRGTTHISEQISKLQAAGLIEIKNAQSKYRKIYFREMPKVNPTLSGKAESKSNLLSGIAEDTFGKSRNISKGKKEEAESFADYWNSKANLPTIRKITPQRKAQLKTRMQEPDFAENWEGIIDRVAASAFCTGENDRGWKADIDWILKNSGNYTKVLEGKYDNKQESVGSEYVSQPVETVFEKKLKAEKKRKLQEATNV